MKLLDRLERRFGRYAVENTTLFIIACQVLVFVMQFANADGALGIVERMRLDPGQVYKGEVWRLVTFLFIAPLSEWWVLVFFFWYLFYLMGTALEQSWGVFKFNVYCGMSYFATVAASFLAEAIAPGMGQGVGDYLYGSIFLAFARLFPEFELLLFFLIPVKVKWLALLQWLVYGFQSVVALRTGDWFTLLTIVAAVLNYLYFFGQDIWQDIKQGHRRNQYRAKALKASKQKFAHECRVCGLTREMAPRTAFRYCSKCAGQCCYCPDHIHNHECVTEDEVERA